VLIVTREINEAPAITLIHQPHTTTLPAAVATTTTNNNNTDTVATIAFCFLQARTAA
jgi:hypothetical protein